MTGFSFSKEDENSLRAASLEFYLAYADVSRDEVPAKLAKAASTFLDRTFAWLEALPMAKETNRGRGREQTKPSQWMIHLLRELELLQSFLAENTDRPRDRPFELRAIENRSVLSRFAIQILIQGRLQGGGVGFPLRQGIVSQAQEQAAQEQKPDAEAIFLWGGQRVKTDVRRLDRAISRQAIANASTFFGWRPSIVSMPHDLTEWLNDLSMGGGRDIKLQTFTKELAAEDIPRLLPIVERRMFELRVIANLADNTTGEGRRRRLAFFDQPTPLYALAHDLLAIGWAWSDDAENCSRALDLADAARLEEAFGTLLSRVVAHAGAVARQGAARWIGVGGFEPFVGIAMRQIGQGAEGNIERGVLRRVAKATLRQREQIIVLTHHAETLRRWLDAVEQDGVTDAIRTAYNSLLSLGFHGLRDWAKRTRHDCLEGVLFPSEMARRDAGAPVPLAPRLSVEVLRAPYPVYRRSRAAGNRLYADVTPGTVRDLIEFYYDAQPIHQAKVLDAFDELITARIIEHESIRSDGPPR